MAGKSKTLKSEIPEGVKEENHLTLIEHETINNCISVGMSSLLVTYDSGRTMWKPTHSECFVFICGAPQARSLGVHSSSIMIIMSAGFGGGPHLDPGME